jgi:hypothetical protein
VAVGVGVGGFAFFWDFFNIINVYLYMANLEKSKFIRISVI